MNYLLFYSIFLTSSGIALVTITIAITIAVTITIAITVAVTVTIAAISKEILDNKISAYAAAEKLLD